MENKEVEPDLGPDEKQPTTRDIKKEVTPVKSKNDSGQNEPALHNLNVLALAASPEIRQMEECRIKKANVGSGAGKIHAVENHLIILKTLFRRKCCQNGECKKAIAGCFRIGDSRITSCFT